MIASDASLRARPNWAPVYTEMHGRGVRDAIRGRDFSAQLEDADFDVGLILAYEMGIKDAADSGHRILGGRRPALYTARR
jgi:hypothetical protein